MKFFLILSFCIIYITSTAQRRIYSNLRLVCPTQLTYDTLLVKDSKGNVLQETSTSTKAGKTILTYLIGVNSSNQSSFSIYFGGSPSATNDTLYFLSHGRDLLIEFGDSFALRNHINFKLRNVYNFEELYRRYTQYGLSKMQKYDFLIKVNSGYQFSRPQYFLNAGLDFVKKNVANPYSVDLFSVFVINTPGTYIEYSEAYQFYIKNLKNRIKDPKDRMFVENKIAKLRQSVDEGNKAPDFTARSIHNKLINSASLSGKSVLLTFWATWCEPCMKELPYIKEIFEEYKGDDLVVISVSLDRDSVKMVKAINDDKLDWIHIFNNKPILELFRINPIPAIFLIDEKGTILYNNFNRNNEKNDLAVLKSVLAQKFKH